MKGLLSFLLLLVASAAGAVEGEAPKQGLRMDRTLTAHLVGATQPQNAEAVEILVLDTYTGATTYTVASATPRTFIGMPVNLDGAGGANPMINKIVVYLAYAGATAQTYNSLRVRFLFADAWSGSTNPVFSSPVTLLQADANGPITLAPDTYTPIQIGLDPPVPLSGLTARGISINFQGDTGAGLGSSDNLTSLLRYGTNPIAVGANPMPNAYGYRNSSYQTNFNYAPFNSGTTGQPNEAVVLKLYAAQPLISQAITNFVANPANPIAANGNFTVSASGGTSGNPVVFSIDPASADVCTASGTNGATISPLARGTCTVLANQAGNASYSAAPQQSLDVPVAGKLVLDGSLEAGYVTTYWAQDSTNFYTPICDLNSCGGVGPRTGTFWAAFGNALEAEAAWLAQTGVIAPGPTTLSFYVWWESSVVAPPDPTATFNAKIDGNTIFALTPATAAAYNAGYTLASVDISAYADGNSHTLAFEWNAAAASTSTNLHLDDISVKGDHIFANGFQ